MENSISRDKSMSKLLHDARDYTLMFNNDSLFTDQSTVSILFIQGSCWPLVTAICDNLIITQCLKR